MEIPGHDPHVPLVVKMQMIVAIWWLVMVTYWNCNCSMFIATTRTTSNNCWLGLLVGGHYVVDFYDNQLITGSLNSTVLRKAKNNILFFG